MPADNEIVLITAPWKYHATADNEIVPNYDQGQDSRTLTLMDLKKVKVTKDCSEVLTTLSVQMCHTRPESSPKWGDVGI